MKEQIEKLTKEINSLKKTLALMENNLATAKSDYENEVVKSEKHRKLLANCRCERGIDGNPFEDHLELYSAHQKLVAENAALKEKLK